MKLESLLLAIWLLFEPQSTLATENLLQTLHRLGLRKPIQEAVLQGPAFVSLCTQSISIARSLDLECEVTLYSEIWLKGLAQGYQVLLFCAESPMPGLALYFDLKQTYLGQAEWIEKNVSSRNPFYWQP